ncbi:MAG: hypothetical protein HGA71_20615, partial [Azonexaceae bacterium]|nr:hypothetical protein [Azonexaceae bacterium]
MRELERPPRLPAHGRLPVTRSHLARVGVLLLTLAMMLPTETLTHVLNVTLPVGTTFDHYQVQVATDAAFSALVIDDSSITTLTSLQFTPVTDLN